MVHSITTFIRGAALVSAASMLVFASVPANAKSNPRMEAVKACAVKANAEFGKGKLVNAKTKRLRKGYAISMTKLSPEGNAVADITCEVRKGDVAEYAATRSDIALADASK